MSARAEPAWAPRCAGARCGGGDAAARRDHRAGAGLPGLARAQRLLDTHLEAAVRRFGPNALGVIDLPPLSGAPLDGDQVRVAATLLWAREVEAAGLPGFVEALAEGLVRGTLLLPLTTGGDRLMRYWRGRGERFTADERQAIYTRLFGDPAATGAGAADFAAAFDGWLRWLSHLGRLPQNLDTTHARARAQAAGRAVAQLLSDRAVGMAAFAARDIVANVREAIDILRDPDIATVLGGSPWQILRMHAPQVLGRRVDPDRHLARAEAGQLLLSWLADHAAALTGAAIAIARDDSVVAAAERWLLTMPEVPG